MFIVRPYLRCVIVAALAATQLAGCGKAKSNTAAKAAPIVKAIFTTTNDCIASQKIPEQTCIAVIEQALAQHEKGTSYTSLQQCHKVEGADRCDKTVNGQYRPRLIAFYVTMATPPTAEPLYAAAAKKAVGFRSPTQKLINAQDDTLIVSASALAVAHDYAITK